MNHSAIVSVLVSFLAVTPNVLCAQPSEPAAQRISYGTETTSFGELLLPRGDGPFPVAVLIHGGCWLATRGGVEETRPMAQVLATHGIATWNVEYRRVGHSGGGWPGSFRDLADATDFLRSLADDHPLDLARVALVGHSSGGYFAAWLAGRRNLATGGPLTGEAPLPLAGLIVLDAFLDHRVADSRGVDGRLYCDEPILPRLFGGEPDSVPDRVRQGAPLALLPYGISQKYVVSSLRYPVIPARPLAAGRTTLDVADYPKLAASVGDSVEVHIVPDADHFDFLKPDSAAWPAVETAIVSVLLDHSE